MYNLFLTQTLDYINKNLNELSDKIDDINFGNVQFTDYNLARFEGAYEAFYSIRKLILSYLEVNNG